MALAETVLVTGGAGFIGSHLVERLLRRGNRVRVLERKEARVDHLPLGEVDLIIGDIRERDCVHQAVKGCEVVYHLAANPQLWVKPRRLFQEVNYHGAVNVMEEALAEGVHRILHTSTESILTRARQSSAIREDQVVSAGEVIGPYCRSKYRAECYALTLARQGAPILIVNPTLPVGPGDWGLSPPSRMMLDFCKGKRKEYLDAELNLIDVRDVAEGMVRVMEVGQPGRRYLLGGENLSIRGVFAELAALTGLPEPTRRVPYWVALMAAAGSELFADLFFTQPPAATLTGVRLTRRRMHFDASASLAELKLPLRGVRQAIADAVNWFRESGLLQHPKLPGSQAPLETRPMITLNSSRPDDITPTEGHL